MKKVILILVSGLLLSGNAYSLNFTALKKFTEKDWSDPSKIMYIYQRCGAVMAYTAIRARDIDKNITNTSVGVSSYFVDKATEMHQKINNYSFSESSNHIINKVEKLISLYKDDSNKIYLQTGDYLSGIISSDANFCVGAYTRLKSSS